jgi:two-component system sensor histidine kinase UhpB
MSLRLRLICLACGVFAVSFVTGGVVSYLNARRSVRTEMSAALQVGRQTIENALARLSDSGDPAPELTALVASFDGDRHLRVALRGSERAVAAPPVEHSRFGPAPDWFVALVGVRPQTAQLPVRIGARVYGTVVVETDPYNETLEVWNEFTDGLVAPALLCALTVLMIYVFIGRMLRPLDRLTRALEEVGDGRFRTRFGGRLPPELVRLRDSFNRMAARLADADADNRRLNAQLLTSREEERSELARDLHDEVGPYLFAIGADAALAARSLREHRAGEAQELIQSIADAVQHAHRQVRRLLGRLRPIGLEEQGLTDAIENIVGFWRRRQPEIEFRVSVGDECRRPPDLAGTIICRVVQEAVNNAMRHAEPRLITIAVDRGCGSDEGDIRVEVTDDGRGMAAAARMGYGLIGIEERLRKLGGRLSVASRPGEGCTLTALLPLPRAARQSAPAWSSSPCGS